VAPVAQTSHVDPTLSMQPPKLLLKRYKSHGSMAQPNLLTFTISYSGFHQCPTKNLKDCPLLLSLSHILGSLTPNLLGIYARPWALVGRQEYANLSMLLHFHRPTEHCTIGLLIRRKLDAQLICLQLNVSVHFSSFPVSVMYDRFCSSPDK
jgi:hypothetical protein